MIVPTYDKTIQAFFQAMVLLSRGFRRQIMNTHRYSPRPRLFVAISSVMFLIMLLAACGGLSTSGGAVTPTPVKTATLQTSCPPAGIARAAIMAPLALGKQDSFVYLEGKRSYAQGSTPYTLKRYTVSTRTATTIISGPESPASKPRSQPMGSG